MRFHDYWKDHAWDIIIQMAGLLVLSSFLLLIKTAQGSILLIGIAWIAVYLLYHLVHYRRRSRYFQELNGLLESLNQRYLMGEMMGEPDGLEDQLYRDLLLRSNKSVIEKIRQMEEEKKEYREYIESWVHEIKTPIAAAQLICENHKDAYTEKLLYELQEIDNEVERALYYARMEHAYQDYRIHPVDLRKVVVSVIRTHQRYLIASGMQVDLQMDDVVVSTDEKWVSFLLKQIFANSIKYRRESGAVITIRAEAGADKMRLIIEDNGCGIAPEDLPRIFEKGFTGKNGRNEVKSCGTATGMGLYLCKRLCEKLEIGIGCESEEGAYTRIIFTFPDTDFQKI